MDQLQMTTQRVLVRKTDGVKLPWVPELADKPEFREESIEVMVTPHRMGRARQVAQTFNPSALTEYFREQAESDPETAAGLDAVDALRLLMAEDMRKEFGMSNPVVPQDAVLLCIQRLKAEDYKLEDLKVAGLLQGRASVERVKAEIAKQKKGEGGTSPAVERVKAEIAKQKKGEGGTSPAGAAGEKGEGGRVKEEEGDPLKAAFQQEAKEINAMLKADLQARALAMGFKESDLDGLTVALLREKILETLAAQYFPAVAEG